ncbi:feruloyl-CoA synthase [Microbaculum marinum]|uniref:Feruloyl-CoA synthase n=1 Tax=Microbaculum marinum TaxID=1764581 RepID=A0AAW9RZB0_9HYPH
MSGAARADRDRDAGSATFRPVALGRRAVDMERRTDGTIRLTSPDPLPDHPRRLTDRLVHWAGEAPERVFLAGREPGREGWRRLTYAETLDAVRAVGTALLDRGLSAERPVVILSGNDIEHALLGLAAQYAGIAHAPVSPAYSLISTDFAKLRYIVELLTPGLVFACDGEAFGEAIAAAVPADCEVVVTRNLPRQRAATPFGDILATPAGDAIEAAHEAVGPDTIAKFLFTSGSTGMPKAVINTQRMLTSNQEMLACAFPYFRDEPPVLLDWAPWNHTAGGNHNFGLVLYNGGTLHIDDGNPTPAGMARTVRNLRDVSPNWYFNVPKGFDALAQALAEDQGLRETFFRDLKILFYAGAGMAQHVWDAMDEMAVATCGARILRLCGFGATETGPFALVLLWDAAAGNLGIPAPGIDLKLVPNGDKLEARIRSPGVMPGYWRQPELTAEAFDAEGYYMFGDAMRLADPDDPCAGLIFDGRIKEDFKLATGTWVNVGPLRAAFIDHFAPLVSDVVIAGLNRDCVAALVFADLHACRRLAGLAADAGLADVVGDETVRAAFGERLQEFAARATGSSNRVARLMLMQAPPAIDRHEMTDKGSINQRAVLENRAGLVEELFADPPSPRVIALSEGT